MKETLKILTKYRPALAAGLQRFPGGQVLPQGPFHKVISR